MLPNRRLLRHPLLDYSVGDFFITICTKEKKHYFGEIYNGEMHLNTLGQYILIQFDEIPKHYPYALITAQVIMTNHLHFMINLDSDEKYYNENATRNRLSIVVGGFKQAITNYAKLNNIPFGWQTRYIDHKIRGYKDGLRIANYIENNVAKWCEDCYGPRL